MKRFLFIIYILCPLYLSQSAYAQRSCGLWFNEVPLVADTAANTIYATIDPGISHTLKGTMRWDESLYGSVKLNGQALENGKQGNLVVAEWANNATNTLTIESGESRQWSLIFSTLPFVVIDCPLDEMSKNYSITKGDEDHTKKYAGNMSVIDARCRTKLKNSQVAGMACFNTDIMIRLRGATSGSKPKKSFNIELTNEGESQDVHLLGYRKDDDWILASEYIDYSRMRNRVLMDLWTAVDPLPYDTDNNYQCNGTQGEFVEAFINGSYYGLMCFTDKIDRKKLNLKKTKEATATTPNVLRGLLWKANWECGETYLSSYSERPANDSFLWPYIDSKQSYGWEQKYPDDSLSQAFFDPICDLIDFLNTGQQDFSSNYTSKLYEQNVIDFILFIQAFQLLDNQKKNYYLSVRNNNKEEKFLFTLWDLDGSIGRYAGGDETGTDAKQMAWGEKLGYHNLIHRFKSKTLRPSDFATKMNNRWKYLSRHQLSLQNIRALMEHYADLFTTSGAWEREKARWLSSYPKSKKIANTPQEEVDFMMDFLTANYAVFNQEMASVNWNHNEYDEDQYVKELTPAALYVIGHDVTSTHEDNTVVLQGSVHQETVDRITSINYKDTLMTVIREDKDHEYDIRDIKEVRTQHTDIYPTPAFLPGRLQKTFTFDTRYAPIDETITEQPSAFETQRTVSVIFDREEAHIQGNLDGITATIDGASVAFTTDLEGVELIISGRSDIGRINIESQHPWKLSATAGGTLLSSINANCDLVINTSNTLNFYNEEFDGKCIMSSGDITIENGILCILMTSSGTLTDASFNSEPTLGARAVMANTIHVNAGNLLIKTIGHHGAVGLAAAQKLFINGGTNCIATYDDPLKAGTAIEITGGNTFTSSLTNDGLDTKGDLFVKNGVIYSCSPEGAEAAFDVNHFYCDGGTVIGVGYKSDQPISSKSSQAFIRLYKSKDVKQYVSVVDAEGNLVETIMTPAYPTTTVLYSSPALKKGETYTILTGDIYDEQHELTTIVAE